MKRKQRQHLKENDLAHSIVAARAYLEQHSKQVTGIIIIAVLVAAAVGGISLIRQRTQHEGQQLLAEAMVALNARVVPPDAQAGEGNLPAAATLGATGTFATEQAKLEAALPKLQAAADAYPDAESGVAARYHLAGAMASLGRYSDAVTQFDQVMQRAGDDSLYGRMAKLGKADAEARSGELDAAIATWKDLAAQQDSDLPVDAILMELARAYLTQGNTEEARKTFTQLVDQHPESPYSSEARQELESLKG
jgi:tetratricopeptide (TPR) repeat protein